MRYFFAIIALLGVAMLYTLVTQAYTPQQLYSFWGEHLGKPLVGLLYYLYFLSGVFIILGTIGFFHKEKTGGSPSRS